MNLPMQVKGIEVFYDGRCGMCCTFHEWVSRQERAYEVRFVPYQDERAERIFPGIGMLDPAREMIVRTAEGDLYRGAEAWVFCLYSCVSYRNVARRLASRGMLPVAKRACALLAANRHGLSKIFFRRKDREVRERLHEIPDPEPCEEGTCVV
jgi:predicted DCC family thiol-disulfide oxidoreductase YuxK